MPAIELWLTLRNSGQSLTGKLNLISFNSTFTIAFLMSNYFHVRMLSSVVLVTKGLQDLISSKRNLYLHLYNISLWHLSTKWNYTHVYRLTLSIGTFSKVNVHIFEMVTLYDIISHKSLPLACTHCQQNWRLML